MKDYCKNCGALLKEGAKFCQECENPIENPQENVDLKTEEQTTDMTESILEDHNFCPNCGKELNNAHTFCDNCGFNLANPETSPQKENFIEKYKIPVMVGMIVVIIAIVGLIAMSSFNDESSYVKLPPQTVTVGAEYFQIPGEYVGDPSSIDVKSDGGVTSFSQGWSDGYEHIYITVMSSAYDVDLESVVASEGGIHKNLMGYDGYYSEDDVSHYSFSFVLNNKICVIETSSPYIFDEILVV